MGIGDLALGLRWSGLVLVDLLVRLLVHDTLLWNRDNAAANTMVPEGLLVSAGGFVRASISPLAADMSRRNPLRRHPRA